jgi:hypothetical protein
MKKIDFKLIAILILLGLNVFQFIQKPKPIYKKVPKEVAVHDTIPMEVPVEVEVPYEVEVPVEKLVEVKIPTQISADTLKIINDYLAEHTIVDTLKLKNNWGYMLVKDVISKNELKSRNVQSSYNIPTQERVVEIPQPKTNEWYVGFGFDYSAFPFFNGANTKLLYKTKSDKMFGLDLGLRNNVTNFETMEGQLKPYIGTSIFIKIK